MALAECLEIFLARVGLSDVFYATTPPSVLLGCLRGARLYLGNLAISRVPHVFIGPERLLRTLSEEAEVFAPKTFARSRGNVLLVRAGNPKEIRDVEDLLRDDVTLFISNPDTETASYRVYADSLRALAAAQSLAAAAIESVLSPGGRHTVFGERIHHREAPQALAAGRADVAVVYYHLALRYVRIFPELFDFVPLGGTRDDPRPLPGVVITSYAVARVGDGGEWGRAFIDFLLGSEGARVYGRHGLCALALTGPERLHLDGPR